MINYNLGRVAFVDRGAYSSSTTYSKWDFVTTSDSTYLYINGTPMAGTSVTDTNYWKCLSDGKPATTAASNANQVATNVANAEAQRVASGSIIASQSTPQTLGSSSARLIKLWATDIDSTNIPTVGGVDLRTALGVTFPQYFDIKAKGDGSGVLQINITVLYACTATINGGYFYDNINGTTGQSTTRALAAGDNSIFMKTNSSATVLIPGLIKINDGTPIGTNVPALSNIVFSPIINYCFIASFDNILNGILSIPPACTCFVLMGNNSVNGSLSIPSGCNTFILKGNNAVSGTLMIPSVCSFLSIGGNNTLSYNLTNTPDATKYIYLNSPAGGNYTYNTSSGQKTWAQGIREVYVRPNSGVWTSAMTDALLIDLSSVTSWSTEKTIDLRGNCGARTSASSNAVSTLQGNGVTVLTN